MTTRTLTARWVFPVVGPPLAGGTVTIRGDVIESVDPAGRHAADEDCGNAAIIPGLVNAHTHLDLSGAGGQIPPTDPEHFTDWLREVIAYRRCRSPQQVQADIRAGLAQCLDYGTTLVGDIAAEGASWAALAEAPIKAVVYFELIGLTDERFAAVCAQLRRWESAWPNTARCRKGVSPHAPYSVRAAAFAWCARAGRPLATHLAETPAEAALIHEQRGPFVTFLQDLGIWQPQRLAPSFAAIVRHTRPAPVVSLIHGNYLSPDIPLAAHQTVVYCPRTHAAFGHSSHRWREFLARGVRVALGTDSLASNPDLDVLAEARWVWRHYPDVPGPVVLRLATLAGAQALGWADDCGSLEPGKSADLVVVPLPDQDTSDPHELLLGPSVSDAPRRTLFRGQWRDSGRFRAASAL
jgi:cytosine/adenosine deaminase-related metal-dependent hydrolase